MFPISTIISLILFPLGFYVLIKGADWLVNGASGIAKRLNISELVIGLTIVAFGTSLPELFVNVIASSNGNTDLAIGNILGSNISNILLILGVCAVIYPLSISKGTIWKEIPLNLLSVGVLFTLANDQLIDGAGSSILSRIDGIVLMAFFIIFLYYTFGIRKDQQVVDEESMPGRKEESREKDRSLKKDILLILAGVITLPIGGQLVINGAMTITSFLGLSESFVGLTLVALGTSAPELATSAVATYKRNANIAIGNIVGSNLFNIFWVLGLSAVIRPLPVNPAQNIDLLVVAIATALLFMFIAIKNSEERWWVFKIKRENHLLSRTEGILFLILYAVYVGFLIWRG